ncbi:MAG TPA: hypothetical protein VIJ09_12260, partial [Acidimicrobiales bacterium]
HGDRPRVQHRPAPGTMPWGRWVGGAGTVRVHRQLPAGALLGVEILSADCFLVSHPSVLP